MIEACQQRCALSTRRFCAMVGLNPMRLSRWRRRVRAGREPLALGGPRKGAPLPLAALWAAVTGLHHGARRTHGTGALYARFRAGISRRELATLVRAERAAANRARRRRWQRVIWREVGIAWSIDGVEWSRDDQRKRLWLHPVQELCSRFRFAPLVNVGEDGVAIARHLETLFATYGAPLFLKRDNGGALNHAAVDAVLAAHTVLPLNSPVRYPRYNGAMENGIREARRRLHWLQYAPERWEPGTLAPFVQAAYQEMNYRPRRCLNGRTAAAVFHAGPGRSFSRTERNAALEWIARRASVILQYRRARGRRRPDAAWRQAAESWLRCQGLITIAHNPNVSPNYPAKRHQE